MYVLVEGLKLDIVEPVKFCVLGGDLFEAQINGEEKTCSIVISWTIATDKIKIMVIQI